MLFICGRISASTACACSMAGRALLLTSLDKASKLAALFRMARNMKPRINVCRTTATEVTAMKTVSLSMKVHATLTPKGTSTSLARSLGPQSLEPRLQILHRRLSRLLAVRLPSSFPRRTDVLFVLADRVATAVNPVASRLPSAPRMFPSFHTAFFGLCAQRFPGFRSRTWRVQNASRRSNTQSRQKPYQTATAVVRHGGLQSIVYQGDGSTGMGEIQTRGQGRLSGKSLYLRHCHAGFVAGSFIVCWTRH